MIVSLKEEKLICLFQHLECVSFLNSLAAFSYQFVIFIFINMYFLILFYFFPGGEQRCIYALIVNWGISESLISNSNILMVSLKFQMLFYRNIVVCNEHNYLIFVSYSWRIINMKIRTTLGFLADVFVYIITFKDHHRFCLSSSNGAFC